MNKKYLKIIIGAILVTIILSVVSVFAFNYLNTGQVIIAAEEGSEISEISISNNQSIKKLSKTKLDQRFNTGVHTFNIQKNEKISRITINVEAGKTYNKTVDLEEPQESSLVFKDVAKSVFATGNIIQYLSIGDNIIQTALIGGPRVPAPYKISSPLRNVYLLQWIKKDLAIANTVGGALAKVDKQNVTFYPLNIRGFNSISRQSYSINNNLQIITEVLNKLYFQNTLDVPPKEILSIQADRRIVYSLSNQGILAVSEIPSGFDAENTDSFKNSVRLINTQSNQVTQNIELDSFPSFFKWSGDGKKLLISYIDKVGILDVNSGSISFILSKGFTKPETTIWLNNDEIIYFDNSELWKINLTTNEAKRLAIGINQTMLNDTSISEDGKYLYYTIGFSLSSGVVGGIYRVEIK